MNLILEYRLRMPDINADKDDGAEGADCVVVEWGDGNVEIHLSRRADKERSEDGWEADVALSYEQTRALASALNHALEDPAYWVAGGVA